MGGPPTQQHAPTARSKGPGGIPKHGSAGPHRAARNRRKKPPAPAPAACATRTQAEGGGGNSIRPHVLSERSLRMRKGGTPHNGTV